MAKVKRFHRFNRGTLRERFDGKYIVRDSGCWEWLGAKDGKGYGQLRVNGKNRAATHIALELAGKSRTHERPCALHRCDNPSCVNPAHLWWGTLKDNSQDSIAKGRASDKGLRIGHAISRARRQPLPIVACENCGTSFETSKYRFQINRRHFCGTECCWSWQRAHFTGTRRDSWAA